MCIPDFLGTDPAAAGGARLTPHPAVILSCGELWTQKEGEMIQTKETGQKCKLDHIDSRHLLIIRKKIPTKPNEL